MDDPALHVVRTANDFAAFFADKSNQFVLLQFYCRQVTATVPYNNANAYRDPDGD